MVIAQPERVQVTLQGIRACRSRRVKWNEAEKDLEAQACLVVVGDVKLVAQPRDVLRSQTRSEISSDTHVAVALRGTRIGGGIGAERCGWPENWSCSLRHRRHDERENHHQCYS